MIGNNNDKDVVTELLARVGEGAALYALMDEEMMTSDTEIPMVSVRVHTVENDKDATFCIDDEPRRLVLIPGFDWAWYNSEGPEE